MRTCAWLLFVGSVLSMSASALAENRAVNLSLGSIGGPLDEAALRVVRQVIGHAVARGTVDTFLVYSPRAGAPLPIEGGLSACAEAGFNTPEKRFNAFIQDLRSIHPEPGTFLTIERTAHCLAEADTVSGEEAVVCTKEGLLCPDGSVVGRVPPACEFAPCPGETF